MNKELIVPIYDSLVYVGIGSIQYQLRSLKTKYGIEENKNLIEAYGFHNYQYSEELKRNVFYVIIGNKSKDKKNYWNLVAHELLHLTQSILEHKGIHFVRHGHNEPYTYTNGYLTGELFEFFEKGYKKLNK